jgi:hypothetical protein
MPVFNLNAMAEISIDKHMKIDQLQAHADRLVGP